MPSLPARTTRLLLGVAAVLVCCRGPGFAAGSYQWNLPVGFPQPSVPDDNPMSIEKVELGRFIFYDTRLSGNQTLRRAPRATSRSWRSPTGCRSGDRLDRAGPPAQLDEPDERGVQCHARLGESAAHDAREAGACCRCSATRPWSSASAAWKTSCSIASARTRATNACSPRRIPTTPIRSRSTTSCKALTSFVRTLISGNSPYDRYINGLDDNAISPSAYNGGQLVLHRTARVLPLPRRLQLLGLGDLRRQADRRDPVPQQRALQHRRHGRVSAEQHRHLRVHPTCRRTWAASRRRRCATSS